MITMWMAQNLHIIWTEFRLTNFARSTNFAYIFVCSWSRFQLIAFVWKKSWKELVWNECESSVGLSSFSTDLNCSWPSISNKLSNLGGFRVDLKTNTDRQRSRRWAFLLSSFPGWRWREGWEGWKGAKLRLNTQIRVRQIKWYFRKAHKSLNRGGYCSVWIAHFITFLFALGNSLDLHFYSRLFRQQQQQQLLSVDFVSLCLATNGDELILVHFFLSPSAFVFRCFCNCNFVAVVVYIVNVVLDAVVIIRWCCCCCYCMTVAFAVAPLLLHIERSKSIAVRITGGIRLMSRLRVIVEHDANIWFTSIFTNWSHQFTTIA